MNIGILLLALLVCGLFVMGRLSATAQFQDAADNLTADLPCPWCRGATSDNDKSCPSCGQTFGS